MGTTVGLRRNKVGNYLLYRRPAAKGTVGVVLVLGATWTIRVL